MSSAPGTAQDLPHVVVVGGGFGGLGFTRRLARAPVRITLVDRRNHHLFQPLLYQVAAAGLSPGEIAEPIRSIVAGQDNVQVRLDEALSVDLPGRTLHMRDGSLRYDHLLLAAGATHTWFGHDEWAPHAPGLKTLDDALEMRQQILLAYERAEWADDPEERRRLLTFVVVGGGPTGVELTGALSEIARHTLSRDFRRIDTAMTRVVLVEAGPTVLGAYPERLRAHALRQLAEIGVEVVTGRPVVGVDAEGVLLGGEGGTERIAARTVLWGAGVAGAPLGASLGVPLDRAGRVLVEPDLSLPGHPEVQVIGDLACFAHDTADGRPLPGVAQVAMQMAVLAADNLRARLDGRPTATFRYRDLGSMATIGRSRAIALIGRVQMHGTLAWMMWLTVHLVQLIGFRNRLAVLVQWAWSYLTWERSSRLIRGEATPPGLQDRGGPELHEHLPR